MYDLSTIDITLSQVQVENIIKEELYGLISAKTYAIEQAHTQHPGDIEKDRQLIESAAIVLKYYVTPDEWEELDQYITDKDT